MDIVMCGVGGQGTVLTSRVLGEAALVSSYQVRTSEIIGMSQREGSVLSQVRIGKELHGPLVPEGNADYLMGFELAETVRNIDKIKPGGKLLVNTQTIVPPSVYVGISSYDPQALKDYLSCRFPDIKFIDAQDLARKAGNVKAVSAVMLGAFSRIFNLVQPEIILEQLCRRIPERLREVNAQAFKLGQEYMEVETR